MHFAFCVHHFGIGGCEFFIMVWGDVEEALFVPITWFYFDAASRIFRIILFAISWCLIFRLVLRRGSDGVCAWVGC